MQNLLPAFLLRFHISVLKNAKTGQLSSERLCQIWADNLTKFQMVVSPPFAPQQQQNNRIKMRQRKVRI